LTRYLDFGDIHHIDSTFKVNIENFQLYIYLVVNQHSRGVPSGYCFMKSATAENIEFFYQQLTGKIINNEEIQIIHEDLSKIQPIVNIIDKDLTNIDVLSKYYPDATPLLCTFHVIKWFKSLIIKEVIGSADIREEILNVMKQMVYARNESKFEEAFQDLKELRGKLQ